MAFLSYINRYKFLVLFCSFHIFVNLSTLKRFDSKIHQIPHSLFLSIVIFSIAKFDLRNIFKIYVFLKYM